MIVTCGPQRRFGKVEVEDQVLALKAAAQAADYIDLTRVAVTGWSYGEGCGLMVRGVVLW